MRLKRQKLRRISLPSIILANVQSIRNKTDELQANTNYLHSTEMVALLAFSETTTDSDPEMTISGFGAPQITLWTCVTVL